jgi:DNA-binding CsgD family transcriptional regulator
LRESGQPLQPTSRQLTALRAYVSLGSYSAAAHSMGLSEPTVRHHLGELRERLRVHTNAQAVYVLWLPYRDHLVSCPEDDHAKCLPAVTSGS